MKYFSFCIVFSIFNYVFSQEGHYHSATNGGGIIELEILTNHTYNCRFPINPMSRKTGDSLFSHHKGTWFKCGNQIILNSYNQPDCDSILNVVEIKRNDLEKKEIIIIKIHPKDGYIPISETDSIIVLGPTYAIINNERFMIPQNGVLEINSTCVKTISILNSNYNSEEYIVSNPKANLFEVYINISGNSIHFPKGSYFKNEVLEMKDNDTLFSNLVKMFIRDSVSPPKN